MTESKKKPNTPPASQQTKKRRRSQSSPSTRKKKTSGVGTSTTPQVLEPIKTLIIDNGGDTLKYGWSTEEKPSLLPNLTARLKHQFTVLVGDELQQVQNPTSLYGHTRSTERGMIVNLGNQTQVWKRMLDKLGVTIPQNSEASIAFGWQVKSRKTNVQTDKSAKIPSQAIAVLLLLPPHCPRLLLDQILYVWMEDFGVSRVAFGISSVFAAKEHETLKTSCTVDCGWSSTLVIPTFKQKPVQPSAIRRLPIGGRHMISMLKYYMSYRQYNLMDQESIIREVFEQLSYLSRDFKKELHFARYTTAGRRPFDRDYVLPDHQTTHRGTVRLPIALQKELERQKEESEKPGDLDDDEDDEDDEDFNDEGSGGSSEEGGEEDDKGDGGDEEETLEQKRKRLLKERAERNMQIKLQEAEEQVLLVSVERFTVPEVLFHPQDAGMPSDLVGLAEAVAQSIDSCPEAYHAALYRSIFITGGVSRIPNLKSRLESELRALVSPDYKIAIELAESPMDQAWMGAKAWTQTMPSFTSWTVGPEDWSRSSSSRRTGFDSKLFLPNGGIYI